MLKHKLKACLIHLLISTVIITLLIGGSLLLLFPQLFIAITDFKEVAILIISIDLVLGPLLTFVVFQPKKKTLKFDLSVIAAIQLSALIYGVYALYQVHPVYITFNVDRFTIVTAKDADPEKAQYQEYKVSKLSAGTLAFSKMPSDLKERNDLLFEVASGGEDLEKREEYYQPFIENFTQIIARSLDPKVIFKTSTAKVKAKHFLSKHKNNLNSFAYLPINSLKKDAIIVLDKESAKPIATLNIDPWLLSKNE